MAYNILTKKMVEGDWSCGIEASVSSTSPTSSVPAKKVIVGGLVGGAVLAAGYLLLKGRQPPWVKRRLGGGKYPTMVMSPMRGGRGFHINPIAARAYFPGMARKR